MSFLWTCMVHSFRYLQNIEYVMTLRNSFQKTILTFLGLFAFSFLSFGQAARMNNEFILQLKKGFSPEEAQQELSNHFGILPEIKIGYEVSDIMRAWLFTFNEDVVSLNEIIRYAPTCSSIQLAQANHKLAERIVPNDPSYGQQWFHDDASDNDIDTPKILIRLRAIEKSEQKNKRSLFLYADQILGLNLDTHSI